MIHEHFVDLLELITEKYDLDYGNGYIEWSEGERYLDWRIEAPNNAGIQISVDMSSVIESKTFKDVISMLHEEISRSVYNFDPDEEFEMLWSKDFSERNNFRPSQFITMLIEDEKYFNDFEKEFLEIRRDPSELFEELVNIIEEKEKGEKGR